jgi:hypothetical protein
MSLRVGLQASRSLRRIPARIIVPSVAQLARGIKSSTPIKGDFIYSYPDPKKPNVRKRQRPSRHSPSRHLQTQISLYTQRQPKPCTPMDPT